jgi:hypothetical protein
MTTDANIVGSQYVGVTEAPASPGFVGEDDSPGGYNPMNDSDVYCVYQASVTGNVSKISWYANSLGGNANVGIYTSDGSSKLGDGSTTAVSASGAVATVNLDSSVAVESGTSYMLVVVVDDSSDYWTLGVTETPDRSWFLKDITLGDSLDSTMGSGSEQANYTPSIWAD